MTATAPAGEDRLTDGQRELRARAREFVEEVLMPLELEAERLGGRLPAGADRDDPRAGARAAAERGRHAVEHGGQGWTMLEWFLVNEQFGRVTNGLHWHVPNAYNVLASGTPEQIDRWLAPALRGEAGGDAYAVTEARGRLGPHGARDDGAAQRRRLGDRRREVVRDLRRRRRAC